MITFVALCKHFFIFVYSLLGEPGIPLTSEMSWKPSVCSLVLDKVCDSAGICVPPKAVSKALVGAPSVTGGGGVLSLVSECDDVIAAAL